MTWGGNVQTRESPRLSIFDIPLNGATVRVSIVSARLETQEICEAIDASSETSWSRCHS